MNLVPKFYAQNFHIPFSSLNLCVSAHEFRHKSENVGKNVNGKPVRVRDALNSSDEILSDETSLPSSKRINAYHYGEFLPLQKITDELQIGEYLGDLFNEKDGNTIPAMALNHEFVPRLCIISKLGMRILLFPFSGLNSFENSEHKQFTC